MRSFPLMVCSVLSLLAAGCNSQKEEEEVDYDHMVKNGEECEWTSVPDLNDKHIAGDLYPEPQEVVIQEEIDAPSKLDSTTIR